MDCCESIMEAACFSVATISRAKRSSRPDCVIQLEMSRIHLPSLGCCVNPHCSSNADVVVVAAVDIPHAAVAAAALTTAAAAAIAAAAVAAAVGGVVVFCEDDDDVAVVVRVAWVFGCCCAPVWMARGCCCCATPATSYMLLERDNDLRTGLGLHAAHCVWRRSHTG